MGRGDKKLQKESVLKALSVKADHTPQRKLQLKNSVTLLQYN